MDGPSEPAAGAGMEGPGLMPPATGTGRSGRESRCEDSKGPRPTKLEAEDVDPGHEKLRVNTALSK